MQGVNESSYLHQAIPTSRGMETASNTVKTALHKNVFALPDDVVTLSADRSSSLSIKKEPSAPVTPAESKALRDSFSVYA